MNSEEILDSDLNFKSDQKSIELVNTTKFTVLCLTSFGLYVAWWMYKSWRFFKEKDKLDIMPVGRSIFGILFAHSLFEKILKYSKGNGYSKSYSCGALFTGFLIFSLSSKLPQPFWLISLLSFIFVIPPVQALNYAITNSDNYTGVDTSRYNNRQVLLIVAGLLFTGLVLFSLTLPE